MGRTRTERYAVASHRQDIRRIVGMDHVGGGEFVLVHISGHRAVCGALLVLGLWVWVFEWGRV